MESIFKKIQKMQKATRNLEHLLNIFRAEFIHFFANLQEN